MLRDAPPVSVLTIHHGPPDDLDRVRDALLRQSYPLDKITWVIVDDASPTEPGWFPPALQPEPHTVTAPGLQTGDAVSFPAPDRRQGSLTVKPCRYPVNQGRTSARNAALANATGEIVAWLDSDMEPVPTWLEALVRAVTQTGGAVVGRFVPHPRLPRTRFLEYTHSRGAHKLMAGARVPGRYFATGNSAVPGVALAQVGGFDEELAGWGGEDLDLGVRLENAGIPIHYEPRAKTLHDHRVDWVTQEQRYREYGARNVPVLIDRHPRLEAELTLRALSVDPGAGWWLGRVRPMVLRLILCEPVFRLLRTFVTRFPRSPWPDVVFDFLIYYLYSLSYRTHSKPRGTP